MKKALLLLLAVVQLASCDQSDSQQLVSINDTYQVSIPSFLSEASDLNDEASLQYQHILYEFYVIVIDEPQTDLGQAIIDNGLEAYYDNSLQGYSDLVLEGIQEFLVEYDQTEVIDTVINSMPAKITTIIGEVDGMDVFYTIGLYEGESNYYQLLTWTLAGKKDRYSSKMHSIVNSFKEVKGAESQEETAKQGRKAR